MGLGILRYSQNTVVCMIDPTHAGEDSRFLTGIDRDCPIVATTDDAAQLGANVLVLGIAPPGGLIPAEWSPALDRAIELGMSLVNGLHDRLAPRYPQLPDGQFVWDVRCEPEGLGVGKAEARHLANRRVLMIGTDMSVGKMTAGLEMAKSARERGIETAFVATGQIGIVISGAGVALDAVRLDFASGAIEREVCQYPSSELTIIEGQGSLIHPSSSANLPLLRGSCPTHMVLCHRAGMTHLPRHPWVAVPPLTKISKLYEDLAAACGVFPQAKVAAIALNTGHLSPMEAQKAVESAHQETGLPVCDPVRSGGQVLVDAVMA